MGFGRAKYPTSHESLAQVFHIPFIPVAIINDIPIQYPTISALNVPFPNIFFKYLVSYLVFAWIPNINKTSNRTSCPNLFSFFHIKLQGTPLKWQIKWPRQVLTQPLLWLLVSTRVGWHLKLWRNILPRYINFNSLNPIYHSKRIKTSKKSMQS